MKKNSLPGSATLAMPGRPQPLIAAPVDLLHWAAVCFVMASIAGVLSVAAGTPALAHAATACCSVFTLLAGLLVLAGIFGHRNVPEGDSGA